MNVPSVRLRRTPVSSLWLFLGAALIAALESSLIFWISLSAPGSWEAGPWFADATLVTLVLMAAAAPPLALAVMMSHVRLRATMKCRTLELARRDHQIQVVSRLSVALAGESSRRGVARTVGEVLSRQMGASRVVYWRPGVSGELGAPWVAVSRDGRSSEDLREEEPRRASLARTAVRECRPLVNADGLARRLDPSITVSGPFTLYLPLTSGGSSQGLLEIEVNGSPWGPHHWQVLEIIAIQAGVALERARHYEEMRELADMDYVTGLFNHRFVQVYLQRLIQAAAARRRPLALLLLDVDNFKTVNDTYGHSAGDRLLQSIADQLKLMTDGVGLVGRYGGDEFIVVLPGYSRLEAQAFAQAFHDWLTDLRLPGCAGRPLPIRLSCGIASFPEDGQQRQRLLAVADARLYQAKRSGRRRRRAAAREPEMASGVFGLLDSLVTSIDSRDHYTRAHCEATAEYAIMLAQELGLSPSVQRTLRLAALLHDVGKICIPDHILRKPGPLSPEEFAIIRHHAAIAEELIVDVPNAEEVRLVARHHHERFDGSGYPDGLKGERIPYLSRILAVADAFSAMTMDRPHRGGLSPEEAHQELCRAAGTQFDPQIVEAFGRIVARLGRLEPERETLPVS